MGNILRSFIDEFVPDWSARRHPTAPTVKEQPDRKIPMPEEIAMPAPHGGPARAPYRPQPTPSHWRAPNM